jgi:PAP2 superfamily
VNVRAAEWINIVTFPCFVALAWQRRGLDPRRRSKITAIGLSGIGLTVLSAWVLPGFLPPLAASVARDWLPYLLLLMFYWQAGQFVTRVDAGFQGWLERWDRRLVNPAIEWCADHRPGRWFLIYLELAYLFCYVSMPLGLATVYLMRMGREADHFWAVVLPATYICYGMLPFLQTIPPRMLEKTVQPPPNKIRAFNLWILRHASIHANTCPSAHVACTAACALVLLRLDVAVGMVFVGIAISIALGAVAGRYHYTIDAILGAIVAVGAYLTGAR